LWEFEFGVKVVCLFIFSGLVKGWRRRSWILNQLGFGKLPLEVAHDVLAYKSVWVKRSRWRRNIMVGRRRFK
jgi:hypothetical protein